MSHNEIVEKILSHFPSFIKHIGVRICSTFPDAELTEFLVLLDAGYSIPDACGEMARRYDRKAAA